jgi:hypothetical protein
LRRRGKHAGVFHNRRGQHCGQLLDRGLQTALPCAAGSECAFLDQAARGALAIVVPDSRRCDAPSGRFEAVREDQVEDRIRFDGADVAGEGQARSRIGPQHAALVDDGAPVQAIALIAALPAPGSIVCVGPPLLASGRAMGRR